MLSEQAIGLQLADLTTPEGAWSEVYEDVEVRGTVYRLESLFAFSKGLAKAVQTNQPFGLRLVPDPDNAHDPYAIKVEGYWMEKRTWFQLREHAHHLGFLPAKMAYGIHKRYQGIEFKVRLTRLELDIDEPLVTIDLMIPA